MVGRVDSAELRRRGVRIGAAEILVLLSGPSCMLDSTIGGLHLACQPLLSPFVLRAGVAHHRPIGPPVERDLALIDFIGRRWPGLGRLRGGEDADFCSGVVGDRLSDQPPALTLGGGEAGDEQGIAERRQMVLRDERRIGDIDVRPWSDAMRGQERRNLRPQGSIHRFI